MAQDILRLNNITFHAHHGVWPLEQEIGQRFELDVEMVLDLRKAGRTDKLHDSVDYSKVYAVVEEVVMGDKFQLVETIAERVAQEVLARFPIESIRLRVRKPNSPLQGLSGGVEVEIERGPSQ